MTEAIIVAAGPTAPDHFKWIAARKQAGARIFAVGTILKALEAAKIDPDFTAAIDTHEETAAQFAETRGLGVLIYHAYVKPSIYQNWKGLTVVIAEPLPGDSVLHAAVHTALSMQPPKLYLVGVDLCFVNGLSHATGSADQISPTTKEFAGAQGIDGYGKPVATLTDWVTFGKQLQRQWASAGVPFFRLDRRGLHLPFCTWYDEPVTVVVKK